MPREVIIKEKVSSIAGLGTGQTDWAIPTGTVEVEVEFVTSVEATASNAISFRDATTELEIFGQCESSGRYLFRRKPPAGATIVRVATDNSSASATNFFETIKFIIDS